MTPFSKNLSSYEKLAKTLNRIPNGFAPITDGTHLRLLAWIFTPEEAEIASNMKLIAEHLKRMSRRMKIPIKKLEEKLKVMKSKGQIYTRSSRRGKKYGLMPFAVGIYEEQIHRIDPELSSLMEEYFIKSRGDILFSASPPIQKIIPVKSVIKTDLVIHSRNEAEKLIMGAKSWGVRECICRIQQEMIGNPCSYPKSVCLLFSSKENSYKESKGTKAISQEEALQVLKTAEEAGLIHSTMNVREGHDYICNCCTCCCGILGTLVKYDQPNAFVKSDFVLQIEDELCTGCGLCIDRCQFSALEIIDGISTVDERCVGCGVCAMVCPEEALSLVPRKSSEISKPPKNIGVWMLIRAIKRKVNFLKLI